MPTISTHVAEGLVKHNLADFLRTEIMNGVLLPGERIVEGKWSARFGVAQGSIREAINLLALEGFVTKRAGRSARVVHFTEQDVIQVYQLRGAIEGLAARLAASAQPDLSPLRLAVAASGQETSAWSRDLEAHQRIIDLIAEGEGEVAEQYIKKAMDRFARTAYDNWERRSEKTK
jgi:DNA-binding GntR family transcriptional regulator